jgi:hypothetical protein
MTELGQTSYCEKSHSQSFFKRTKWLFFKIKRFPLTASLKEETLISFPLWNQYGIGRYEKRGHFRKQDKFIITEIKIYPLGPLPQFWSEMKRAKTSRTETTHFYLGEEGWIKVSEELECSFRQHSCWDLYY